ncbi:MAG: pyruvoyl-dependent arginine decarboxylase, partial [Candidatus Methanofastidiosia archaeon]
LTSMIPKGALIRKVGKYKNLKKRKVGDILNVVMAKNVSRGPAFLSAGLGWAQADEGGIFLEIAGEKKKDVQRELERGLEEMMNARNWAWRDEIESKIVETYSKNFGCVLVVAVYDF